jgi:protein-tyrosine phosphatase
MISGVHEAASDSLMGMDDYDWNDMTVVLENQLYLSSLHARRSEQCLRQIGITVICDVSNQPEISLPKFDGITYHRFPGIKDAEQEDISGVMNKIYEIFMQESSSQGKVLVHCVHGISRSATCVLYCLMRVRGQTLKEAFCGLKSQRSVILPNLGFMRQLIAAEADLYNRQSLRLGPHGQFIWIT